MSLASRLNVYLSNFATFNLSMSTKEYTSVAEHLLSLCAVLSFILSDHKGVKVLYLCILYIYIHTYIHVGFNLFVFFCQVIHK